MSSTNPARPAEQQPRLPDALLVPSAFPRCGGARPELVETHVSWVLLVADRVYKVKKPVNLGFVDATRLEARRHFCEEEVRLNRELGPDVHLGVVPIVRREGALVVDPPDSAPGDCEPFDYAVAMRRLPAQHMLERLLEEGMIDNALLERLARRLVDFHARAATGPGVDEHGSAPAVRHNVLENFEQTRSFAAEGRGPASSGLRILSARLHGFLERAQTSFLHEHEELLARRVAGGRIRDGHGDLHASNICLEPDPAAPGGRRISIFDRIEFSARLRCGDVACDLAFLAMDLDSRGLRAFSAYMARRYAELAQDGELEALMTFYKTYRAIVRGKVGALGALQAPVGSAARERSRARAAGYFQLAASYHLPPALISTSGLPASGKSTVARHLARVLGATLHASDITRKRLAGLASTSRAGKAQPGAGLYRPELGARTYEALLAAARADLLARRSVVIDAAATSRERRAPFRALAAELGAPFVLVEVTCPQALLAERFAARAADRDEPSDADEQVRAALAASFEPADELEAAERVEHSSAEPLDLAAAAAIERLLPEPPQPRGGQR